MSGEAPSPGADEVLCKVYIRVIPDRSEDEIRFVLLRLSPPPGSRRNDPYDRLRVKIRDLSPELIEDTFNIVWPDGEGEHVTLRSSEELLIAVSGTSAPELSGKRVMKLLVLAGGRTGRNNLYDPDEGERHPGVVCDYCCEPIFGYRYRCLNCPDYDLCRRCEATGKIHSGHQMLRAPFPVKSFSGPEARFQIIECQPVHRPSSMDTPTEEKLSAERGDGNRSGRGRIPLEAIRASQEQVARALKSFWSALGVVGTEDCAAAPEEGEEAHAEEHGEAEEAREGSEAGACATSSPSAARLIGNIAPDSWVERSHRTMHQISEVLLEHYHKLGVPSVPEERRDDRPVETAEAAVERNVVEDSDELRAETRRDDARTPEARSPAEGPSSGSSLDVPDSPTSPDGSDEEQQAVDPELASWTYLGQDPLARETEATAKHAPADESAAKEKTAASKKIQVESNMDVKVLAGLEFMKEMGFTDEGGWLSAILQHHGGDVTKVIQLLEKMGLMKFED